MAELLDDVLFRRWERGADNCSTRAIALRCSVNPSTIHEYRHGDKMVPWALAKVLPIEVVEEINETLIASRAGGRTWRWALALVRRGFDWIEERGVRPEDRHEATRALLAAQDRITKALGRLAEEETR